MRNIAALSAAILAALFLAASPASAQISGVPSCGPIELLRPADGAEFSKGARVVFRWNAEPQNAVRREWISLPAGEATAESTQLALREEAQPGRNHTRVQDEEGLYDWFVLFYDASDRVICATDVRSYTVKGRRTNAADNTFSSLSGSGTDGGRRGTRRYIVVLDWDTGRFQAISPYTGYRDQTVNDWAYVAPPVAPAGYEGFEIHGNNAPNFIFGSTQSDLINAYGGPDIVVGFEGDDEIDGGGGSDLLLGLEGNDTIRGGSGFIDVILGGEGDDNLSGGPGFDIIAGEAGNDTMNGDGGTDFMGGGDGNDIMNGGDGDDVLFGEAGNDTIDGGNDVDDADGGPDTDTCTAEVTANCSP
jgi:hypothetical protein